MRLPDTPPPYLRPSITERERAEIEATLGPVTDSLALLAVRDGRGTQFQRFEFLGDSVLDVVLTVHRWAEPGCPSCDDREAAAVVSDLRLAEAAVRAGLGAWLEWRASDERIADLVETCVAACWLSGRWPQTVHFVERVVHRVGEATTSALVGGGSGLRPGRRGRRVGSALLELAAADGLVQRFGDADEGELSSRRAAVHRATAIAAIAGARVGAPRGDPDVVLSLVEDEVAAVLAARGADQALVFASGFVPVDPR
jgi:hypothetical protein